MRELFPITELYLFKFGIATYRPEQPAPKKRGEKREPQHKKNLKSEENSKLRQIEEVMLIFNADATVELLRQCLFQLIQFLLRLLSPRTAICNRPGFFYFFRLIATLFVVLWHWSFGLPPGGQSSSCICCSMSVELWQLLRSLFWILCKVFFFAKQFSAFLSFMSLRVPLHIGFGYDLWLMQYISMAIVIAHNLSRRI